MYINRIFYLSMVLDNEKFQKVFSQSYNGDDYLDEHEDELVDRTLASKGITILYRNSCYKKKVTMLVDATTVTEGNPADSDRLIRKLEKRTDKYFHSRFQLDDFTLSGLTLSTDIDVGNSENVSAYLKVIQRIGKVKGFAPSTYDFLDDDFSFCLKGNSNATDFLIYDLERAIKSRLKGSDMDRQQLKSMVQDTKGILQAEVRLTKPKAIRAYTDADSISGQLAELSRNCQEIFFDTFTRVIPFGDFRKKDKAVEIVHREISDRIMRRRMLRLLALIPDKKSLHLAQKEMRCRNVDDVMDAFARINLSPVTISKRQDVKHLDNLYDYLLNVK